MIAFINKALQHKSLLKRFIIASLILLPVLIILSGTALLNTFKHSQLKAEQETLQAHIYLLLSAAEIDNGALWLPEALTEPRFNQAHSGLYGFIVNDKKTILWRSDSAQLLPEHLTTQTTSLTPDQRIFWQTKDNTLNILSYDTQWLDEYDNSQLLRFIIASDATPVIAQINSYRSRLWQWLGTMGILLILAQVIIMRWGLQPLKHLSVQLRQLHAHKIQQLDSDYPSEIQPIIDNFNTILTQEKKQRERYRNTMSDLAHSLKTPLAVIQSQHQQNSHQDPIINEQLQRINQIIAHQLQRAVIRVNQSPINHNTNKISVKKVTDRLLKIISKVYQQRGITLENQVNHDCVFFGDEADLLEVLGNLIDNACKHGNSHVVITSQTTTHQQQTTLTICISDNGTGVDNTMTDTILQRGQRADTAQPGQGLGLSVAVDIISSYGGEISVRNNAGAPHLSGACFCIVFNQ